MVIALAGALPSRTTVHANGDFFSGKNPLKRQQFMWRQRHMKRQYRSLNSFGVWFGINECICMTVMLFDNRNVVKHEYYILSFSVLAIMRYCN